MTKTQVTKERKKFKPTPHYTQDEVKDILAEKIKAETDQIIDEPADFNEEDLIYKEDKANVLSLFSGAGGLDLGLELAGLDVELGIEKTNSAYASKKSFDAIRDKGIFHHLYANDKFEEALETYGNNFPKSVYIHNKNIRKVKNFPQKADIIVGGPPCPGFSAAGPRLVDDPRNFLYLHYIRALMQVQPKFFVMENVKGMLSLGKGEVFEQIKQDFEAAGYRVYAKLLNSRDFGVPQVRERVFLVGVREDIDFEYIFPEPTHGEGLLYKHYVTLKEAIGDLEEDPGPYFTGSYSSIFMSRNRKKKWNDQSFTIQASGRQAPIHPGGKPMEKMEKNKWIFPDGEEKNRRLSVKEISRIQTFPDWFEFSDGSSKKKISTNGHLNKVYTQIGNAVPVELGRAVIRPIGAWFIENNK